MAGLWCKNEAAHETHRERNEFGGFNECTGISAEAAARTAVVEAVYAPGEIVRVTAKSVSDGAVFNANAAPVGTYAVSEYVDAERRTVKPDGRAVYVLVDPDGHGHEFWAFPEHVTLEG